MTADDVRNMKALHLHRDSQMRWFVVDRYRTGLCETERCIWIPR